jgi:hypothetical protein
LLASLLLLVSLRLLPPLLLLGSLLLMASLFPNSQPKKQGGVLNFKGLLQDGGRTDFSEKLRASLFNDDLKNEPTFSQIHLVGQYL